MALLTFESKNRVYEFSTESSSGYHIETFPVPATTDALSLSGFQSVLENAVFATIQHNLGGANPGVLVLPTWNTAVWYTSLGQNAAIVFFSTPAPAAASAEEIAGGGFALEDGGSILLESGGHLILETGGAVAIGTARIYWEVFSDMPSVSVTENDESVVITHNQGDTTVPIFVTPNWNTTVWDSMVDRTANTATLIFGTPAPALASVVYKVGT